MTTRAGAGPIVVRAHAKLNLTLRVLGTRADGFHDLRTTFQSIALHDTLKVVPSPGPFEIRCDDPACPSDGSNLVWQAAERLWRHLGRRGAVRDVRIRITKRIPMQAGLGGGSSDAAAALVALAAAWREPIAMADLASIGRGLGADVPFFFQGGTALGLERGDFIVPLVDCQPFWVVVVRPPVGISTRDAYGWWDAAARPAVRVRARQANGAIAGLGLPAGELGNDLEAPVIGRHPEIGRVAAHLRRCGAAYAAMSGSGSAVFGLFSARPAAAQAAALVGRRGQALVTRLIGRETYCRLSAPRT
jgi:4-diphosphocytidyl-2-C-methyl-D-erythritol kinase